MQKLSPEEIDALEGFAAEHGRRWKALLRRDWMHAKHTGPLQHLRNASYFGFGGLSRYKRRAKRHAAP